MHLKTRLTQFLRCSGSILILERVDDVLFRHLRKQRRQLQLCGSVFPVDSVRSALLVGALLLLVLADFGIEGLGNLETNPKELLG